MNQFKNIIFDLGGVILDIDYQKTIDAFHALGFVDFHNHYTQAQQNGLFDALEVGEIQPDEFIGSLKNYLPVNTTNQQIIDAWNALLLNWNKERIVFLQGLKDRYALFLFSNTNAIHKAHFDQTFQKQIGLNSLDHLFKKAYYSHNFGMRKPHQASFLKLINENQLNPEETLFIDDSVQHIEGAKSIGLQTLHLTQGSILDLNL